MIRGMLYWAEFTIGHDSTRSSGSLRKQLAISKYSVLDQRVFMTCDNPEWWFEFGLAVGTQIGVFCKARCCTLVADICI